MASKLLSGSSPTALVITAIISGALGVAAVHWHYAEKSQSDSNLIRYLQAELRCKQYWAARSGEADAEYRFKKGHRALLEVVVARDPSIEYDTPGVRSAKGIEVDRTFPLTGPKFDDLSSPQKKLRFICRGEHVGYAWAYNVAMLRMLGRSEEAYLIHQPSPELTGRDVRGGKAALENSR